LIFKFIKQSSPPDIAQQMADKIASLAKTNGRISWFLSGGSCIPIEASAANLLNESLARDITGFLIDERFGQLCNADSNFHQLQAAGFPGYKLRVVPVLEGLDINQTTQKYDKVIRDLTVSSSYKIGVFGIGADGHIAGILPNSPALLSTDYVTSYDGVYYQQITTTEKTLRAIDETIVYAAGPSKHTALNNLREKLLVKDQPAQLLKLIPQVTIYNDLVEGDLL